MSHRNKLLLLALLALGACNSVPEPRQPPVAITSWPVVPDLSAPESDTPQELNMDYPRKPDGTVDTKSNLYMGFSPEDYKKWLDNEGISGAREQQWRNLLLGVNKLFQDWRERDAAEKQKLADAVAAADKAAKSKKKRFGIF